MINFCRWSVCPRITCDKVSSEGYEVENLIAKEARLRERGFLADHFINAPICVTVSFPCNVHIHSVIINPVVGAQKSTDFEIFSQAREINASNSYLLNCHSISSDVAKSRTDIFVPIGKVRLQEPKTVIFQNKCFAHLRQDALYKSLPSPRDPGTACCVPLSHHRTRTLTHCSHIRIRICRTKSGSVPAMKLLEIWGQPSRSCEYALCKAVYDKYSIGVLSQSYCKPNNATVSPERARVDEPHNIVINNKHVGNMESGSLIINGTSIPDEFIDPITCDLITLPVLLPSGQTVDQQTLDKYIHMEETWGRPAGDPFTGIPFTDICKPITNSSLKIRIDNFVMKNSDKLHSVPRTLGRAKDCLASGNILNDNIHSYANINSSSTKPADTKTPKPKQQREVNPERVNSPIYTPSSSSVNSRRYSRHSCINDRVEQENVHHLASIHPPKGKSSPSYHLSHDCRSTCTDGDDDDDDDDCVIVGVSSHFDKISTVSSKRKTCTNMVDLCSNTDSKSKRSKARHGLHSHSTDEDVQMIEISHDVQSEQRPCHSAARESAVSLNHENQLTLSLEDALSAALKSLPSYCPGSKSEGQFLSEESSPCSGIELLTQQPCDQICSICSTEKCDLYKLLCSHILCRDCLKQSTNEHKLSPSRSYICLVCQKDCLSKDITKLNF